MKQDVAALRQEYAGHALLETDLAADPIAQFGRWFADAAAAGVAEPNVMQLATATPEGQPSVRTVLLKGYGPEGFTFFTNYESRKGRELEANPRAALVFWWDRLARQVTIEGAVHRVPPEASEAYFHTRPRGSRLGAWASAQSQVVSDRQVLDARYTEVEARFPDETVPRPPHWGGYVVEPDVIEFWQGQPSRLHDRIRYRRTAGEWRLERLCP